MKNIYKSGGIRKTKSGSEYTIKSVNDNECALFLKKGWVATLDEIEGSTEEELLEIEESKNNEQLKTVLLKEIETLNLKLESQKKAVDTNCELIKSQEKQLDNLKKETVIEQEKKPDKVESEAKPSEKTEKKDKKGS